MGKGQKTTSKSKTNEIITRVRCSMNGLTELKMKKYKTKIALTLVDITPNSEYMKWWGNWLTAFVSKCT